MFVLSVSSRAQIKYGFLGSVNYTSFSGDTPPNGGYSSDIGYGAGAALDIYILDDIVINLQPMFSNKSTIVQFDVDYQYENFDSLILSTDYFEIPINVKVIANNKIAYVTAGLNISFLLNSTLTDQSNGSETDVKDSLEPVNLAANFGIGAQFRIGLPVMFIEARYTQSITNITKQGISKSPIDEKVKSNSWQLFAGLLFEL